MASRDLQCLFEWIQVCLDLIPAPRWMGTGDSIDHSIGQLLLELPDKLDTLSSMARDPQRMYVRRGYIPDGRGILYNLEQVPPGEMVRNDDDATLMFTKSLRT